MKSSRMKKILAVILCLTLGLSTNMMTMAESVNNPAVESVQEDPAGSGKEQTVENAALQTTSVENTETEAVQPTEAPVPTEAPTPEATPAPTETAVPEVTAEPTEAPVEETTPVPTETPTPEVAAEPTEAPVEETTPVPEMPQVTETPETAAQGTEESINQPTQVMENNSINTAESFVEEDTEKINLSRVNSLGISELYKKMTETQNDELYFEIWNSLNEDKRQELVNYILNIKGGEVFKGTGNNAVNFAEAAKLLNGSIKNSTSMKKMARSTALNQEDSAFQKTDNEEVDGVQISKKIADYDEDTDEYILQLEAFVTGNIKTEVSTKPVDVVLVLDQSGSMKDNFGNKTEYKEIENCTNAEAWSTHNYNQIYTSVNGNYREVTVNRQKIGENEEYTALWNQRQYYSELDGYYFQKQSSDYYYELKVDHEFVRGDGYYYIVSYVDEKGQTITLDKDKSPYSRWNTEWGILYERELVTTYEYRYTYIGEDETEKSVTSEGNQTTTPISVFTASSEKISNLEALKESVETFVANIQQSGSGHRVAIVGFASKGYSNTEVLTGVDIHDNNGVQYNDRRSYTEKVRQEALVDVNSSDIQDAIDALTADGGTSTGDGLAMAEDIFNAQDELYQQQYTNGERKKVVIVFTDGEPTGSNMAPVGQDPAWDNNTVQNAFSKANLLKNSNTTVYSVGIFKNADGRIGQDKLPMATWTGSSNANKFMHLLSSNFLSVQQGMSTSRNSIRQDLEKIPEGNSVTGFYRGYYLSASDPEGLNNIFESISDQIGGADVQLGNTTVLHDVISEYFELPEDVVSGDDIKVYTAECEHVTDTADGPQYTFGAMTPYMDAEVQIGTDRKTIQVTNFDYSTNYVGLKDREPVGKKLVVEIPVKLDCSATFGGNNIPTNQPTSGIYDATGKECYGNFEQPVVNVPIDYKFLAQSQTIHLTKEADLAQILEYANGYRANGINNKFVTIEYTLSDNSGAKVGTFSIPAGVAAENGTWTWENGKDANPSDLTECTDYFLTCTVSPSEDPTQIQFGTVAEDTELAQQNATVHVLIPEINCFDTTVFIHDIVPLEERYNSASINWVDKNKDHTNSNVNVITTAPSVTVTPEYVSGTPLPAAGDYRPEEDSDFKLEVMAGGTDITGNCDIISDEVRHTDDCIKTNENEAEHDFTIHVVAGSIQINKKLLGKVNTKLEGNPVFTFRIVYQGQDGSTQTFYRTIEFEDDDKDFESAEILKGLPRGTYTVTELTTQKFKFDKLDIEDGTTCKATKAGDSVIFEIGESTGENKDLLGKNAEVTFTNEKVGPSTNTDTDVVVNRFVFDEASNSWTVQQIWNPGEDQIITIPDAGQTSSSGDNQ